MNASATKTERSLVDELTGALRFIIAFYEPGQRYLDTEAWKHAEAGGRRALARGEAALEASKAGLMTVSIDGPTLANEIWLASNCADQTGARDGSLLVLAPEDGVVKIDAGTILKRLAA